MLFGTTCIPVPHRGGGPTGDAHAARICVYTQLYLVRVGKERAGWVCYKSICILKAFFRHREYKTEHFPKLCCIRGPFSGLYVQKCFSADRILYHGSLKTGLRIQNAIYPGRNRQSEAWEGPLMSASLGKQCIWTTGNKRAL